MRPPRKAGGNRFAAGASLNERIGFNEAPAKSGGNPNQSLITVRKEIRLQ